MNYKKPTAMVRTAQLCWPDATHISLTRLDDYGVDWMKLKSDGTEFWTTTANDEGTIWQLLVDDGRAANLTARSLDGIAEQLAGAWAGRAGQSKNTPDPVGREGQSSAALPVSNQGYSGVNESTTS